MYHDNTSTRKRRSQRLIEAGALKKRLQCPDDPIYPTILTLPTEILLLVINNLSQPWKVSLALTCKSFMELTHRGILPRLKGEELTEFLSTLQQDIPNTFFCYYCGKINLLNPHVGWGRQGHKKNCRFSLRIYELGDMCASFPNSFPYFTSKSTDIFFTEVNLVMNRHFNGFSHGISPRSLERYEAFEHILKLKDPRYRTYLRKRGCVVMNNIIDTKTQIPGKNLKALPRKENAWRFSLRSTSKIVDNKLFIARFYTIVGPLVTEEYLKYFFEKISLQICNHLTCSAKLSGSHQLINASKYSKYYFSYSPCIEQAYPWFMGYGTTRFDPEQDSCSFCNTDYDVLFTQQETNNETNLEISIYHCLGSCRSPNDKLWKHFIDTSLMQFMIDSNLNGGPSFEEPKFIAPRLDRGRIRRKWHEAA